MTTRENNTPSPYTPAQYSLYEETISIQFKKYSVMFHEIVNVMLTDSISLHSASELFLFLYHNIVQYLRRRFGGNIRIQNHGRVEDRVGVMPVLGLIVVHI